MSGRAGYPVASAETNLENGVDEKCIGVGEDEERGFDTSWVLKELDATFHGGVLPERGGLRWT